MVEASPAKLGTSVSTTQPPLRCDSSTAREITHQKSFEKALYAITPNFPTGKLPGDPAYTDIHFDMSQGAGNVRGPWRGELWEVVDDCDEQAAVDGGDGSASVVLTEQRELALAALSERTKCDPASSPLTGAELGAGLGAGATSAKNI